MPRDASDTKARLLRAGEQLFALHGVDGARAADINKAAGQSNESALHYHFGSRQGLLLAIVRKHIALTEPERRSMLAALHEAGLDGDVHALVAALVVPDAERLHTEDGRDYLRIIAQLAGRVGVQEGPAVLPVDETSLSEIIDLLLRAVRVATSDRVARERVAAAIGFLTFSLADRARRLTDGERMLLAHRPYVDDLVTMLTGALTA